MKFFINVFNKNELYMAVESGNIDIIKLLISNQAYDINSVSKLYKYHGDFREEKLRRAILRADVGAIVYAYRLMLNKIDKLEMKEKGFIPFNPLCNPDAISKLIEYVDRTESISFALIDVT